MKQKIKLLKLQSPTPNSSKAPIEFQMVLEEIEKKRARADSLSHPTTAIGTINFGKELAYKECLLLLKSIKW